MADDVEAVVISIPSWSDFNFIVAVLAVELAVISIPSWSDFNRKSES